MKLSSSILRVFVLSFFCLNTLLCIAQKGEVTVSQNDDIDKLLKLKKEINKDLSLFKIQIYNGSRSGALEAKSEYKQSFNEWPLEMTFETPNYKIWIGNFKTRLEADRALLRIKKKFGNAFIFKPKKK